MRPPDNLEYFLTQVYASTRASGKGYRSEFGMSQPPRSVQRILFPVVVGVGRLLGLHRRFEGAPEPVHRS